MSTFGQKPAELLSRMAPKNKARPSQWRSGASERNQWKERAVRTENLQPRHS